MKCIPVIIISFWTTINDTMSYAQPDDLVYLTGKILDAETSQPVEAKVRYELRPVSNVMGIRFFDNQDGHYQLNLQQHRRYTLEVTAEDYLPLQLTLQTDESEEIPKNLLLKPIPKPGGYIQLSDTIWFDRDLSVIRPEAQAVIEELKALMEKFPKMVIQLEGHTDRGGSQSLLELSEERAERVKDYLNDLGIRKRRIKTKAYGNSKLITRDNTVRSRQKNRRVEIKVLDI
ncbi:OmpA family protein [Tunicatimonas pelagia]|uniref:OmpA family protein n=1 Tax=Tunicatimonas pelagia TaxID=931531 RepID=UPI002667086E|nr:OmpA family protein [Tunicatimonas pelagia]WKN42383.1 OmpA family protein [Tunicatimonas pelagia]